MFQLSITHYNIPTFSNMFCIFFLTEGFGKLNPNSTLMETYSKVPIALEELDLYQCTAKSDPAAVMPPPTLKTVIHGS